MRPLYICLAMDDNYVPLASVAIESILSNNKEAKEIEFFILDSGITEKNKDVLRKQIQKANRKINFYNVSTELKVIEDSGANSQGQYNSYACYARFFIIDKLPQYVDKILYVDCDTCMCDSVDELFEIDLENNILGAVLDILPNFHKKCIKFNDRDKYFNTGVLLFNCQIWKDEKILNKIKDILMSEKNTYSFHDQDIINIVCKNRIKILPPRYMVFLPEYLWGKKNLIKLTDLSEHTYYEDKDLAEAVKYPCIIHYVSNLFGRPWFVNNHGKYDAIWNKYVQSSPFADNYPYIYKKKSIKHRIFIRCYYILPKNIFISIYKKRRNKILLKRELNNEKKFNN